MGDICNEVIWVPQILKNIQENEAETEEGDKREKDSGKGGSAPTK